MPFAPEDYTSAKPYDLLAAAARGHVAFDQRLVRALSADSARTLPDLIRFSQEDHQKDRVDLSVEVMTLFTAMPAPEAVPFLVSELRRFPGDAPFELLQLALRLGPEAVTDPLLDLFDEPGHDTEAVFVALTAGATGPRVDKAIESIEVDDPDEAAFLRDIASTGRGGQADEYVLWDGLPEEAAPDVGGLPDEERGQFLESASAYLRRLGAASFVNEELSDRRRQQMLRLGATDPDPAVRGTAWEALREHTDMPVVLEAMKTRLAVADDPVERASVACALAYHADTPGFHEAVEQAYSKPETRAKAIECAWRARDRRWAGWAPLHLDDSDLAIQRQAIVAAGFFQLRAEAHRLQDFFDVADLRDEALFAYALAAPADDTRYGLRMLEKRIAESAGLLTEFEEEIVRDGLETRLAMAGRRGGLLPPATPAASDETAGASAGDGIAKKKVGRNDPCPCGSGKKYKKCCG